MEFKVVRLPTRFLFLLLLGVAVHSCNRNIFSKEDWFHDNLDFTEKQLNNAIRVIESSGEFLNPVTLNKDSTVRYCAFYDWQSGFFPGIIWYLYELTGDTVYLSLAHKYTSTLTRAQNITNHHDIGFIVNCSFGNGYRLTGDSIYKKVIVHAAKSLSTRFRPIPGIIQSWDVNRGWQSQRGWQCPVTINNLMNLELLFKATELSGDSLYFNIAVSHADRTLAEHCRPDGSCYNVVDYDLKDGSVRNRQNAQGYSHESIWSRGQSVAIYGFTVCYRVTHKRKYLNQAIRIFNRMKYHAAMPVDLIPYWDMEAPGIPNELRDAASAACMAAALYEICLYDTVNGASYESYADSVMESLSTPFYRASLGKNGNFLLMHCVGSIPHNNSVDAPMSLADYYFVEALKRKQNLLKNE